MITKKVLIKRLKSIGVVIHDNKYVSKRDILRIFSDFEFELPEIPDELKHAKTIREKRYLDFIKKVMDVAVSDPMTGLQHRQSFESKQGKFSGGVFLMIDGDGLKRINTAYGHSAGNAAILALGAGIKKQLRSGDKIERLDAEASRYGGDEFVIYLKNSTLSRGVSVGKRILESIQNEDISKYYKADDLEIRENLGRQTLSASIGVGLTYEDADKACYLAKDKGRGRVEWLRKEVEVEKPKEQKEQIRKSA